MTWCVVLVTVYGTALACEVKSTVTMVDALPSPTLAWSVAEECMATSSSLAVPEGLAIHGETSTSTDCLSMVSEAGTRQS